MDDVTSCSAAPSPVSSCSSAMPMSAKEGQLPVKVHKNQAEPTACAPKFDKTESGKAQNDSTSKPTVSINTSENFKMGSVFLEAYVTRLLD